MTLYSILFYLLATLILAATGLAITRRNLVHAVIYLVLSFFGSALLFYLLGAPLLAALEVIIYAGAIMVLFLFIVMMLDLDHLREKMRPATQWLPAAVLGAIVFTVGAFLVFSDPDHQTVLQPAMAVPRDFGYYLFRRHWLAIEIVSLLLLIALVGALQLGKVGRRGRENKMED
jgi:NADH-quinone oxidoreductase subunit J